MEKGEKLRIDSAFEVKLARGSESGTFAGYGAVFGNTDLHGDVIAEGAFADTLKQWGRRGKLPKMLLMHGGGLFGAGADDMVPVGQWKSMEEDKKGLYCEGQLFAIDTDRGKLLHQAVTAGELDGLSIGFRVLREDVDYGDGKNAPVRTIKRLDLFEVSLVTFGANPRALIDQAKSAEIDQINTLSEAERLLCETGAFSRKMATAFVSRLNRLSQREAAGEYVAERMQRLAAQIAQA